MTQAVAAPRPAVSESVLTRWHVLYTSAMGLFAASLYFLPGFPFHPGLCVVALVSAAMHLGLFLLFPFVTRPAWNAANAVNMVLLGFALHFSGGILSPFSIFLALVFIAGAGHRIHYPFALACAVAVFLALICVEYSGLLPPIHITPAKVYASAPMTALIVLTVVGHMFTAGSIYKVTVNQLRARLEAEQADKDSLRQNLSELQAFSHVGRMAAKIAHDMRGPLGAFRGLFQLFVESPDISPQNRKDCELMTREVDRVEWMLGHILKYVRPGESSRQILRLAEILDTVVSVICFLPGAKNVLFHCDYHGAQGVEIEANKEELQQIFFNILKNCLDALEDVQGRREVLLDLEREGATAVLRFRDNGRGIPKSAIETLSKRGLTTKQDGSGFGLQIVRELLDAYGGRMEINSIEGTGTEITLWLPLS